MPGLGGTACGFQLPRKGRSRFHQAGTKRTGRSQWLQPRAHRPEGKQVFVVGIYRRFLWQAPELEAGGGRVWAGVESQAGSRRLRDPVSELKPGDCT